MLECCENKLLERLLSTKPPKERESEQKTVAELIEMGILTRKDQELKPVEKVNVKELNSTANDIFQNGEKDDLIRDYQIFPIEETS